MKVRRLLLLAFGPFTDVELDFSATPAGLHLVYGLNEAGKSTALRAMTDLRFGIPLRSADSFVHAPRDLRIAAEFTDAAGQVVGLMRRKGRGQTLSRFEPGTWGEASALEVRAAHERALTGGLERREFESMFGLNHERLRDGGRLLVKGEGELGMALFEASVGTRAVAAVLSDLDSDAKALFNPRSRAHNQVVNAARKTLDRQRRALRAAQVKPPDWHDLQRAHEAAGIRLEQATSALETLRRRDNELTELRTVEPLLREHDRLSAALAALAQSPDLPERAREERIGAEQALGRAREDLAEAEAEVARCSAAREALAFEPVLLQHADAIERLAANADSVARNRVQAQQQHAAVTRLEAELAEKAARVAPGRVLGDALGAAPSQGDRVALDRHLGESARLLDRLDAGRERLAVLQRAPAPEPMAEATDLPDDSVRETLAGAVRDAMALGDVARQQENFGTRIGELEARFDEALQQLGVADTQALRAVQPPPLARIDTMQQQLTHVGAQLQSLRDEDQGLERDLEALKQRQRESEAPGGAATEQKLRAARARRDEGWSLMRRAYVERTENAFKAGRGFDKSRPLPEAFAVAQADVDRQADELRALAGKAAIHADCAERMQAIAIRRAEIDRAQAELLVKRTALRNDWRLLVEEAHLPANIVPENLSEWLVTRERTLALVEQVEAIRAERDDLLARADAAAAMIEAAMIAVDSPRGEEDANGEAAALPGLIDAALAWEREASRAQGEQGAQARAERAQRGELGDVERQHREAEAELAQHRTALADWCARLFLPADSEPDAIRARLEELDDLARQAEALREARQRHEELQAVIEDFDQQAATLAVALGETAPGAGDDFAERLRARLADSRSAEQEQAALRRDRDRALAKKQRAQARVEEHTAVCRRLCAAAGVAGIEDLAAVEDAAARKRETARALEVLRQQLAAASNRPEAELRAGLADLDAFAIDAERERCRAALSAREEEQAAAREAEEKTRHALHRIDSSDRAAVAREAMECALAGYRAAVRPWAQLRLAQTLLREAVKRFRERAQVPMISAASEYFALMTGGRYRRLLTEDADKPVLRAERADGVQIGLDAMSEGTADQLYLALRLAALTLRSESAQMPLILDDVLVTSDDQRAGNILRGLANFAAGGQVMLFTHHRHLVELARETLPAETIAIHEL